MHSVLLRGYLVRKATIRFFYEQPPSKQVFFREAGDSELWMAKYLIVGCGVGLFLFGLSSIARESKFAPPFPERTRVRLMQTYGLFSAGILLTGSFGIWANKRLAQTILTNPLYAKYFCGGGALFTIFAGGLTMYDVLPPMASYPIWFILHAGLGCLAPAYSFILGPLFYEACMFFGISLCALGVGGVSSYEEDQDFQPNHIRTSWVGGMFLGGLCSYILYPGLVYGYHYFYLIYFSYVYTRDSTRTLQEVKSTAPKHYSPATSAMRVHFESWNRARRGLIKAFTYFGSAY